MSAVGTFRTSRDVRVESAMRFKADIGLAERGFMLRQANSANEKAAGHCAQRPTGLKINWL